MVNSPLPRVLILRDEPSTRPELAGLMTNVGHEVSVTAASGQALSWMTDEIYDVIIIDLDTLDLEGIPFMQAARRLQPDLQMVIMTSRPTLLTAIAAIRAGAADDSGDTAEPLGISRMNSKGVNKTPIRFEIEAAQTAPATLPPEIEVKAIELCTVEGRQLR